MAGSGGFASSRVLVPLVVGVVLLAAFVSLLVRGFGMGVAIIPLLGASFIGMEHAVVLQHASTEGHGLDGHGFGNAFRWAIAFTTVAAPVCLLRPGQGIPSRSTVRWHVLAGAYAIIPVPFDISLAA
ncbi:hypothetical protein OHB04_03105 [Streptomyces sp. NBC_01775]|uniref:hypothetical protein n=1 Tax=Streptomyces sp. NBC_01775 TaxID=2975939 RepID=UPI002DDA68AF|nr:hypothetical protein [Streptomyces sp. NBC_01775]WSB81951.1 hypothetical protein OHB04_03105 [Streptomyces sp. NBC_01775]